MNTKHLKWQIIFSLFNFIFLLVLIIFTVHLSHSKKELEMKQKIYEEKLYIEESESKKTLSEQEIYEIAEKYLKIYRSMYGEYFMTFLKTNGTLTNEDQVIINGVDNYYLVTDERYPTLQAVKNHIETICTKEYAERLYKENWRLDGERPFLAETGGKLYTQIADAPFGLGNLYIPLAYIEDNNIVFFYKCIHDENSDYEWVEEGIMTLEQQNGAWYVKNVEEWK